MAYDAIVIGARTAGAATALLLARRGRKVLVVERAAYGSDTLSTHALMRGGVLQLHRWGVLERVKELGTPAVRSTSFHYPGEVIDLAIKPRDGIDALYSPRRTVLDRVLVDAAQEAGARFLYGVRLVGITKDASGRVRGVVLEDSSRRVTRFAAELVIGADGMRSTVAQLVRAGIYRAGRYASGVVYGYWEGLDVDANHWYFGPGVSAGAIPTNDGMTLVFSATSARRFQDEIRWDLDGGYDRVLKAVAPELRRAMNNAKRVRSLRGFPGVPGFFRLSYGPGWALVGDAGYFKDPLTAHGITDAFRDAELLVRAMGAGCERALFEYQARRDALSLQLFRITDEIASFGWSEPELKKLHVQMSVEMNREVKEMVRLGALPSGVARNAPLQMVQ